VRPSVAGDLMAVGIHLGDDIPPVLINGTLADVVTGNEEGCMSLASFELSHDLLSEDIWTIIVGDGNGLWLQALPDTQATVLDASKLTTGIVTSGGSVRSLVSITAWTILELAVRGGAVLGANTAVSLANINTECSNKNSIPKLTAVEQQ
jgi:hypothetical protein